MSLYSELAALQFNIVAVIDMCALVNLLAGGLTGPFGQKMVNFYLEVLWEQRFHIQMQNSTFAVY